MVAIPSRASSSPRRCSRTSFWRGSATPTAAASSRWL